MLVDIIPPGIMLKPVQRTNKPQVDPSLVHSPVDLLLARPGQIDVDLTPVAAHNGSVKKMLCIDLARQTSGDPTRLYVPVDGRDVKARARSEPLTGDDCGDTR